MSVDIIVESAPSDNDWLEARIIMGMINSDIFLGSIYPYVNLHLATKGFPYMRWCVDYFDSYKKAPKKSIWTEFNLNSDKYDKSEIELYGTVLSQLQTEYESIAAEVETPYFLDKAIDFFYMRSSEKLVKDLEQAVAAFNREEIERLLTNFKKVRVSKNHGIRIDQEFISNLFIEREKPIFTFSGAFGEMVNQHLIDEGFISILAPEKRGKCIHGSEKVLLANGLEKTIEQVVRDKDRWVMSYNEHTKKFVKGEVVDWWVNGKKDCVKVTFKSGREIAVTSNHPFLSPDGWKPVADIGIGGFVANPKCVSVSGIARDPHIMRLLGYLIADGNFSSSDFTWTKADKILANDFRDCVTAIGDAVRVRSVGAGRAPCYSIVRRTSGCNSRTLLRECGLWGHKSVNKFVPQIVLSADDTSISHFLNALFSGDGWAIKEEIGITFASEILIDQINSLLLRLGIIATKRAKVATFNDIDHDVWSLSIRSGYYKALFAERIGMRSYKGDALQRYLSTWKAVPRKSFLERVPWQTALTLRALVTQHSKDQKIPMHTLLGSFTAISAWRSLCYQSNKHLPTMIQSWLHLCHIPCIAQMLDQDIFWDEVIDIKTIKKALTYDLSVKHHHNFVASRCLVHNTWLMLEIALTACRQRVPTVFLSCGDMSIPQIGRRLFTAISRANSKPCCVPVLDCYLNQTESCTLRAHKGNNGLKHMVGFSTGEGKSPRISRAGSKDSEKNNLNPLAILNQNTHYSPCAVCRRDDPQKFTPAVYWKFQEPIAITEELEQKTRNKFLEREKYLMLGDWPSNTLTVQGIHQFLENLQYEQDFIPRVVIIDYADLMLPNNSKVDFRHQQNEIWKDLRGLAQERKCLIITATQANRDSYGKDMLDMSNPSEDKRKLAHVTAMFGLNQTWEEKQMGVMRVNQIVARESDFSGSVTILQSIATGQPLITSYRTAY